MKIQLEGKGLFNTIEPIYIEYARVAIVEVKVSSIQTCLECLKVSEKKKFTSTSRKCLSTSRTEQVHYRTFVDLLMIMIKLRLMNMILYNKSGNTLGQNIQGLAESLLMPT
jgi:hypothetical protein